MTPSLTKVLVRGGVILSLGALVAFANVVRSDFGGYTFATGSFNLKIDSRAVYNGTLQPASTWALKNLVPGVDKFFNLSDVKPGDNGQATISFHVNKDSWICLDFDKFKETENGENEPESLADTVGPVLEAELADGTEFFAWYDDGDNTFEVGELPIFGTSSQAAVQTLKNKTYALADSLSGTPFPKNVTKYVGIHWCAGNLTVNLATAVISCDGTVLGNAAQTDSFSVDVGFRAVPSLDNKKFKCDKPGNQCVRSGCNTCSKPEKPTKPIRPKGNNGVGNGVDPAPPGIGNSGNDGPGTGPGNSGGSSTAPGRNRNR